MVFVVSARLQAKSVIILGNHVVEKSCRLQQHYCFVVLFVKSKPTA